MGQCVSSSPKDAENEHAHEKHGHNADQKQDEEEIKRQRRRLSVAPNHVGDVTFSKDNDPKSPAGTSLNELEEKAIGQARFASRSQQGRVPYNKSKVNQDREIIQWALGSDPEVSMFGVMDGHGEFGHLVAEFVRRNLPVFITAQKDLKTNPHKAIHKAVMDMCKKLQGEKINISFSGTTSVFGVKIGNKLYSANIGDSRCVLYRKSAKGFEVVELSRDQKPENPEEKARILKAGGRVEPLQGPPGEDCGPPRVWLAEMDVPGLAMSRSIGDEVSQSVGVTSEPEIKEHTITENDLFVVWASDGVWEFVSNKEACNIIYDNLSNLKEAALKLCAESSRRWEREEEVIDDITCVIYAFK